MKKKKNYKSLQNYSTSISFNYLIRNSIKINRKYLWKTLQISYLVTVALSKRSILFWTRTIGIFPHSSSTFNEKNQNLKLKLRKKLNCEKKRGSYTEKLKQMCTTSNIVLYDTGRNYQCEVISQLTFPLHLWTAV